MVFTCQIFSWENGDGIGGFMHGALPNQWLHLWTWFQNQGKKVDVIDSFSSVFMITSCRDSLLVATMQWLARSSTNLLAKYCVKSQAPGQMRCLFRSQRFVSLVPRPCTCHNNKQLTWFKNTDITKDMPFWCQVIKDSPTYYPTWISARIEWI